MFFFPDNKFQSALSLINHEKLKIKELQDNPEIVQVENAKYDIFNDLATFNYHIRRYLGLGFFLSFFPGTKAYTARSKFSERTQNFIDSIASIVPKSFFGWLNYHASIHGPIVDLLALGPVRRAFNHVFTRMDNHIATNNKLSIAAILGQAPILNEIRLLIFSYDGLNNFIHSLLNPMRFIDQTLFFLQLILNRISEIGAEKNDDSPAELKTIIAIPFAIAFIPVTLVKEILDIPYQILNHMLYRPLKFFVHSVTQALGKDHKKELSQPDAPSVTEKTTEASKSFENSHSNIMSSIAGIGNTEEHDKPIPTPEELIVDRNAEPILNAEENNDSPRTNTPTFFKDKDNTAEADNANQAHHIDPVTPSAQNFKTIFTTGNSF